SNRSIPSGCRFTGSRSLAPSPAERSAFWRVVALIALMQLPVLFETRKDAVEVVRLDLHPLRQLRDRNPGLLAHMRQHLLRPTASAARAPRTPGRRTPLGGPR